MVEKYFALEYYGVIVFLASVLIVAAIWLIKIWLDNRKR